MTSSDHHRSSTYAASSSISLVNSGPKCSSGIEDEGADEEYEYEYEEIEVEEEIEEEVEVEEEIEVEEGEDREEEEEEETVKEEEEEEDPEEEQEEEEEAEASREAVNEGEEVIEDEDEEERVQHVQEEGGAGAPNSSIPVPNDDPSQEFLSERRDDRSRSNPLNPMINLETMAPSKSDSAAGKMLDDNSSGPPERPIKNVDLDGDDRSASKGAVMSNVCQLEVHAGGDKDVDLAQTLKRAHIGSQDVDPAQRLKRAHIDFHEKVCSGAIVAKLDELMDVKDSQVPQANENKHTSECSLKGNTGGEVNPYSDSKDIDEQLGMQPKHGNSKSATRLSAPVARSKSVSPEIEANDREKRPALICEFFAKGWCIKGSACRFLHKRENSGNTDQLVGGDIALQNRDRGSQELAESRFTPDGSGFITSSRDTTGGIPKQNILSDMPVVSRSSSEIQHNFSEHESVLRGFNLSFSSHLGSRLSYHSSREEASLRPSQYMCNDLNASGVGSSMNHSHMPDWRSHFSSHSSLRQDCFAPHKAFTSNKGDGSFRSSLVPSSGAGMERSYQTSASRESRFSYGYKSKFIPYNWEPSAPFRPSFSASPLLSTSSPRSQYDPIHDCIEQPDKDTSVKRSPGVGLSHHGKSNSWNTDKRQSCSDKKDVLMMDAESAAPSGTEAQVHTSIPKDMECGDNHQNNELRHRVEQNVEKGWQNSEMDLDPAEYEAIHREKALKHFRAALIEFVKELLRPMWHEGHLTRDAFKIIVQKAEEKVVNSLQTNQIPDTGEQTKQYLSSSRTKILKLLEGYAVKYRKPVSSQLLV